MSNIFVSLKYSRSDADHLAQKLSEVIVAAGHQPVIAYQEINARSFTEGRLWMPFIRDLLREADLLLVVDDSDLRGGLIEVGIAYALHLPIWVICQRDEAVSNSLLGCAEQVMVYEQLAEVDTLLGSLLSNWKPD